MKPKLTLEQEKIIKKLKLIEVGKKVFRRKNFILIGKLGSGKTFLLKQLAAEKGFEYVNFTKEYLEDFYYEKRFSFRYLNSNDFLSYVSEKFSSSASFFLLDALEPIIISIYQSGGKQKLINLFKNFFIQKPRGNLLLSIPKLTEINLVNIIKKSDFNQENIFYLEEESVGEKLAGEYQLPSIKVNEFKNNHYFKVYKGGNNYNED